MMTHAFIRNKIMRVASGETVDGGRVPYKEVVKAVRDGGISEEELSEKERAIWLALSRQASDPMEEWRRSVVTYRQAWEVACMSHTDFGMSVRVRSTEALLRAMRELRD